MTPLGSAVESGEAPERNAAVVLPAAVVVGGHRRRRKEGAAGVHEGVVHALGRLEEGVDVSERAVVHVAGEIMLELGLILELALVLMAVRRQRSHCGESGVD